MNGCGFFIWQLKTIAELYTPKALAKLMQQARVDWVTWKIMDGALPFNQDGGNDKLLVEYMQALEAVGIVNSGWGYSYGNQPGPEGANAAGRIEKFQNNLAVFDTYFLDIEAEWKGRPGSQVDLLLNSFDVNKAFNILYCSYRFPNFHAEIKHERFLKHPKMKATAPQVYWEGAHNPADQLIESYNEYRAITSLPFIPIGATYANGAWEPTCDDLKAFVSRCKERGWSAYGFYSLDWLLQHQKFAWLEAISGGAVVPPTPAPAPVPNPTPAPVYLPVVVKAKNTRVYNAPKAAQGTDVGSTKVGARWTVIGQTGKFWRVEGWIEKDAAK